MSEIDFQNGFLCGMATKGMIRTYGTLEGGDLLAGYPIVNGSAGVWPLVLDGSEWVAYPQPSSAIYQIEGFSRLCAYVLSFSVSSLGKPYRTDALYEKYVPSLSTASMGKAYSTVLS